MTQQETHSTQDRRKWRRITMHAPVQVTCDGQTHVGQVRDISARGLSVSRIQSPLAQPLKLIVPLPVENGPQHRLCLFHGRVAWHSNDATGIELDGSPAGGTLAVLHSMISTRLATG